MSVMSRLSSMWPFSQKISGAGVAVSMNRIGQPVWTGEDYQKMSLEAYTKCVIAYRCIKLVAGGAATIPLCVFDGDKEIDNPNHPFKKLLAQPNPWWSGEEFFEGVVAYFLLNGNSYVEGVVGDFKPLPMGINRAPDQLWNPRPDRMTIIASGVGTPQQFLYRYGGLEKRWDADPFNGSGSIIHWKDFNPVNDWYGMGATRPSMFPIDTHNEATGWNKALLQNSGSPSGALVYTPATGSNPSLGDEQYKRLKDQIADKFSGPRNAGKPLLLDGGFNWVQMGLSPKDMDWITGKNTSAREIAHGYGVAPFLLGIPGDATFNNYREARQGTYEDTIIPILKKLLSKINQRISPCYGPGIRVEMNLDGIPALDPKRAEKWTAVGASNWLTTNEKREATGYEKLDTPEADEVLIASTQTPLTGVLDDPTELDPNQDPANDPGKDPEQPNQQKPKKPKKPETDDEKAARKERLERKALNTLLAMARKKDKE